MKLILAFVGTAFATLCSNSSYPYMNGSVTVPIVAVAVAQKVTETGKNTTISVPVSSVSGNINVNSGCQFSVSNFIFNPQTQFAANYTWYGYPTANSTFGYRLVADLVGASSTASTKVYQFTTDPQGSFPPQSYLDFQVFELFDLDHSIAVAKATLPKPVLPSNLTVTNSAPTTTSTSPTETGTKNAAKRNGRFAGGTLALLVLYFF